MGIKMFVAQILRCDICKREIQSGSFPEDWWEVQINKGGYLKPEDSVEDFDIDCCSKVCLKKALKGIIGE
jgi:hypothetical protein